MIPLYLPVNLVILISLQGSMLKKSLIYFSVFHNKGYLELLQILLASFTLCSSLEAIDILVLTSSDFKEDIDKLSSKLGITLTIFALKFTKLYEALCSRLYIFEYPHTMEYEKILYLDTDIIIQGNLEDLLNSNIDTKLYALREGNIGHCYWGGEFFDFSKLNLQSEASGFNSGVLLFRPTNVIKTIFSEIVAHISEIVSSGKPLPDCPDQSLLNYYFIKNNLYNLTLMDSLVKLYSKGDDVNIIIKGNSICHFTWPIGNTKNKKLRMIAYYSNFLKAYSKQLYTSTQLIGVTFHWSNYGFIRMEKDGLLVTSWMKGTYKWIDSYSACLSWSKFTHILKFNSSYSEFLSIRLHDLDLIRGNLKH